MYFMHIYMCIYIYIGFEESVAPFTINKRWNGSQRESINYGNSSCLANTIPSLAGVMFRARFMFNINGRSDPSLKMFKERKMERHFPHARWTILCRILHLFALKLKTNVRPNSR